jgi:hypothetical protein
MSIGPMAQQRRDSGKDDQRSQNNPDAADERNGD